MSGRRALWAQARVEVLMTLRRGESVLLTLGIPVLLLVFFSLVDVLPTGTDEPVDFLAPGVLALAVMSTAMVGLAIATGFERSYGVLKRLGVTPLGRPALLTAKTVSILLVELVQLAVLVPVAVLLGWDPSGVDGLAIAAAVLLATAAFAGLGLLMAGTLPALTVLALANGLYLVLLLLGGMVVPLSKLPAALRVVAEGLPAAALATVLHRAFSGATIDAGPWIVLVVWAVAAPVAAAVTFRWE
jgi:ABC-2 type transport system permease protein